jgi:hypothetical protein
MEEQLAVSNIDAFNALRTAPFVGGAFGRASAEKERAPPQSPDLARWG